MRVEPERRKQRSPFSSFCPNLSSFLPLTCTICCIGSEERTTACSLLKGYKVLYRGLFAVSGSFAVGDHYLFCGTVQFY